MPKLNVTEDEEKNRILRGMIANYMELNGMNDEIVAIKIRCAKRTFQNRKKCPETFTVAELRRLFKTLKIPTEQSGDFL